MCEEVQDPANQVPKAMCGALILNWLCGLIFLIPLMFVLPALLDVISDPYGQPLPFILRSAIGNEGGAFALTVPILVLAVFCGVACTTAASRCVWAFSRDGAIPGSKWWKSVNKKLDVPLNAMMLSMVVQLLLGLIYFGSYAAFNAFSGSGVIFLTISYVMPIFVSLVGGRKHLNQGSWNFGTVGIICNVIAIGMLKSRLPYRSPSYLHIVNSLVILRDAALQLSLLLSHHGRHDELCFSGVRGRNAG
jgi:amino acid transporter